MCERIIDRNKMKISAKQNITSTISYHRQSSLWFRIHLWWKYIFDTKTNWAFDRLRICHRTVCDVLKCTSTIANNNKRSNSSICHYQLETFPLRSDCEPVHWCIVSNICEVGREKRRERKLLLVNRKWIPTHTPSALLLNCVCLMSVRYMSLHSTVYCKLHSDVVRYLL